MANTEQHNEGVAPEEVAGRAAEQAPEQAPEASEAQDPTPSYQAAKDSAAKRFVMSGGMMAGGGIGTNQGAEKVRYPKPKTLGLPAVNIGALFMPPIWGPAHGNWLTILFYPIWVLADDLFYAAYTTPNPLTIVFAVLTFALLAAATIMYAMRSQVPAYARALERGKTREEYLRREGVWAIAMILIAIVLFVAATYYNLAIKPGLGA